MYLLGTEMDYKKEELSSTFVFKNPNETERCGCGPKFNLYCAQSRIVYNVIV